MSIAAPRRVGIAGLLGLLAGAIILLPVPGNPGALRLAGVGLLWWYAALAAPLAAILLVIVVRRASAEVESGQAGAAAIAVWTSPVVLALVAARVFTGAPEAPTITLAVLVAPLVALLGPAANGKRRPSVVAALAISGGVGLVLWANFLLLADVAGLFGVPRWVTSIVAAGVTLLVVSLLRGNSVVGAAPRLVPATLGSIGRSLLYMSGLGFVALVAIVAVALAVSPWDAWRDIASRPALTFDARNPWVTDGRTLAALTTLEFTEAHRVTALNLATYRVFEPGRFREWQLRAGESLSLRAGDHLVIDAGARLRFEAGKRVPGAAASGVAWADPPERSSLSTVAHALGAALTLVAGAVALLRPAQALTVRAVSTASGLVVALVLGALCLGVYGAYSAPGLFIGSPALAAVFDVPAAVVPGAAGSAIVVLSALVLLLLFSATVLALRGVLGRAWGEVRAGRSSGTQPRRSVRDAAMAFLVVAASLASLWPGDASRALMAGLGLAASAAVAPRLAGDRPRAGLAGSLVGVIAFAGLAILGRRLPAWADVVWTYPALAAAPLAWVVARAETVRRARRAFQ